jgi:hypothetical protein
MADTDTIRAKRAELSVLAKTQVMTEVG